MLTKARARPLQRVNFFAFANFPCSADITSYMQAEADLECVWIKKNTSERQSTPPTFPPRIRAPVGPRQIYHSDLQDLACPHGNAGLSYGIQKSFSPSVHVREKHSVQCNGMIDWQGAVVAPFFMQATFPKIFIYTRDSIDVPCQPPPRSSYFLADRPQERMGRISV